MQNLYSENDLRGIEDQLKKRYILIGVILAVLLGVIIWSFIARIQWLSVVSLFLLGAVAVFTFDLFCLPLRRYKKLIVSALSGRTHTDTLEYECAEPDLSMVDGVSCRTLLFLGAPDKHGTREQRYYWDAEIPLPAFEAGAQILIRYTGKNIIGYQL